MVNKFMEKVIEALVEEEKSTNPERYKGNNYYYYSIVVNRVNLFIENYEAIYLKFENELINTVIVDYNRDKLWNFILKHYSGKLNDWITNDEEYLDGMEDSGNSKIQQVYQDIYFRSMKTIAHYIAGLAIDAFNELNLEERLCFFLILEEQNIKPTKELYEKFCNCGEDKTAFLEEMKINSILN